MISDRVTKLIDQSVAHERELQKGAAEEIVAALALFDASEPLLQVILDRYVTLLKRPGVVLGSREVRNLLAQMRQEIFELRWRYAQFFKNHIEDAGRRMIEAEWLFLIGLYGDSADVVTQKPSDSNIPEILGTIVVTRSFETWMQDFSQADTTRITDTVTTGLVQGRTKSQILASVLGDKAVDGRNGSTNVSRTSLHAIADNALFTWATQAREDFSKENEEELPYDIYWAVIDERTTVVCRKFHQRIFRVGQGPVPPLHWFCRSIRIALPRGWQQAA